MKQFILLFAIFIISCNSSKVDHFEIGKRIPNNLELKSKINLLVSPSQLEECYKTKIDSIEYVICIDKDNRLKYISTIDKKFITPDSVRVGMKLSDALKYSKYALHLINGWAYVLSLNSGWNAAFEITNYDSNTLASDSTVRWIYKR